MELHTERVPIWNKYVLTVEEAARYFQIGENKIRRILEQDDDQIFILKNGNRRLIKRKLFEEYIDRSQVI